jgi:5'-nucleotidase
MLTGAQLLEVIEASTYCLPKATTNLPQAAGIRYSVDTSVPYANGTAYPNSTYFAPANPGSRVTIAKVGDKDFLPEETYSVAVSSYIASGSETYYAVAAASQTGAAQIGYTDTDALINYLTTDLHGNINGDYAESQKRFTIN